MWSESGESAGYALLYRGLDHGRMRDICKALNVPRLKKAWRKQLGRDAVSQDTKDFVALQEARHPADYDPRVVFSPSGVSDVIEAANHGLAAFGRIAPDEQTDILTLMLVTVRI